MFSSVSSIFGNPAQGNYSAANAFLDSLAHHRRASGLPALTINWGVLGGEGYVARNERVREFLAKQGTSELSPGEVTAILESSLHAATIQVAAIRVDWAKWRAFFRGMPAINGLLEPELNAGLMLIAVAIAVVVGVVSGLYPAWRSSRLAPSIALQGG